MLFVYGVVCFRPLFLFSDNPLDCIDYVSLSTSYSLSTRLMMCLIFSVLYDGTFMILVPERDCGYTILRFAAWTKRSRQCPKYRTSVRSALC